MRANKNIYIRHIRCFLCVMYASMCECVCVSVWLCHVSGYATLFATPTSLIILTKLVYLCCSCLAPDDARRVRPPPTSAGRLCVCVRKCKFQHYQAASTQPCTAQSRESREACVHFRLIRALSKCNANICQATTSTHTYKRNSHTLAHSGTSSDTQLASHSVPKMLRH